METTLSAPGLRTTIFALAAVLAGCGDVLGPTEKYLALRIDGPRSVAARRDTVGGRLEYACEVKLKSRAVGGREGAYATWGTVTTRFYDLPADTLMPRSTMTSQPAQASTWLGGDRIEPGQTLDGWLGGRAGRPFRYEAEFPYYSLYSPDRSSAGLKTVLYSFRCE